MNAATCHSCGAPILWAVTVKGAHIPLDPTPARRFVPTGEGPDEVAQMDTYETHFATCPHAAQHRKRRHSNGVDDGNDR